MEVIVFCDSRQSMCSNKEPFDKSRCLPTFMTLFNKQNRGQNSIDGLCNIFIFLGSVSGWCPSSHDPDESPETTQQIVFCSPRTVLKLWQDASFWSCRCRPQTQQQKFVNWQCDAEFKGEDYTATVTIGNPDVLVGSGRSAVTALSSGDWTLARSWHPAASRSLLSSPVSGIVVTHYLQSITPALALGGELVYHSRPGEEGTVMSLAGRYTGETPAEAVTINCCCFVIRFNPYWLGPLLCREQLHRHVDTGLGGSSRVVLSQSQRAGNSGSVDTHAGYCSGLIVRACRVICNSLNVTKRSRRWAISEAVFHQAAPIRS